MAHIVSINFAHTSKNQGCTCDRCGQWITNIWSVKWDDGLVINFGMDCFDKLLKNNKLSAYGMKLMHKALKSLERHQRELDAYVSGKMNADNDNQYKYDQEYGGYWQGRPYEEFRDWMINEWFPQRFKEDQKEIDRFSKINFKR